MRIQSPFPAMLAFLAASLAAFVPASAQGNAMWRTNGNSNAASGHFIGTTDNSALVFKTDNTERMRIGQTGTLRVATLAGATPAVLAVHADGSVFRYTDPGVDSLFDCSTKLYRATGNYLTPDCFIGSTNKAPFRVFTHNTERMRLTDTGDMGIGTAAPQTPMHFHSAANAELRIQGATALARPQVGLAMGTGPGAVKLADLRAGFDTATLLPEAYLEVNDGGGTASMKAVLTVDATSAEVQARLGVGMAPQAGEQVSVNGGLRLVEANNPSNHLRMGHDGANAYIEHATPTPGSNNPSRLFVNQGGGRTDFGGNVILSQSLGIGTASFIDPGSGKDYRLSVDGRIRCKEVKVYSGWADHVFGPGYRLMPLSDVDAYIAANGRLPGMPSACEVAQDGVDLGATQALLLEKIEELTLHLIRLEKENAELRADVDAMKQ